MSPVRVEVWFSCRGRCFQERHANYAHCAVTVNRNRQPDANEAVVSYPRCWGAKKQLKGTSGESAGREAIAAHRGVRGVSDHPTSFAAHTGAATHAELTAKH